MGIRQRVSRAAARDDCAARAGRASSNESTRSGTGEIDAGGGVCVASRVTVTMNLSQDSSLERAATGSP
jgi:hypothetical protein